jgi:hypothetical protein
MNREVALAAGDTAFSLEVACAALYSERKDEG